MERRQDYGKERRKVNGVVAIKKKGWEWREERMKGTDGEGGW